MKFGIVNRSTQGKFRYQGWPTVTKGEDGTIFAASSGHRLAHVCPFGKNLMYTSTDDGESWTAPQIINDTYLDDRDAGLLAWGEGTLLLTWFNHPTSLFVERAYMNKPHYDLSSDLTMGMRNTWDKMDPKDLPYGSFTKISYDNGKTWSEPRRAPITSPHGPMRLEDGTLFFVGRSFHTKELEDGIYVYTSQDDGATWQYLSRVPAPEGATGVSCEPHAIQLKDKILVGVRYHNLDVPGKLQIYTVESRDGGKTWENAHFLDLLGAPPHFLLHSTGALIMVYGRRCEPMGQYARVSYDQGKTWGDDFMVSPVSSSWDQGYPSTVELKNGDLLTVYYQKYEDDPYCSLLSTHWSLKEAK